MRKKFIKKIIAALVCAALVMPVAIYGIAVSVKPENTAKSLIKKGSYAKTNKVGGAEKKLSEDEVFELKQGLWKRTETNTNLRKASFTLFKKLTEKNVKSGKNTMISPVSLIVALGMLENGAKGESLRQIESATGIKVGELNEWYSLWSKLNSSSGKETLKLANSVWYKEESSGLRVKNEFLKTIGDIYTAQAFSAKFDENTVNDVNSWVKKNTDGMIKKIIEKLSKDSRMLLINATTFKGVWLDEYDDINVKKNVKFKRENGKIDRVIMLSSVEDEFFENKYLTGTKKYYKDGYYIMLMRPKKGYNVSEVIEKMNPESFDNLLKSGTEAEVHLKLPCFKYDYKIANCKSALKKMGITDVFDELKADLSGMAYEQDGTNLYVDKVIHKTHIELDREGTKAAAVTAIGIEKATAMPISKEVKKVTLNKPFIYAICDQATNVPVFIGTVNNID